MASCGGDGATLFLLSAMVPAYSSGTMPPIALLRGGSVNTIAANLGIAGTPEQLLERLVASASDCTLPMREQDLLRVGEHHGFLFASAMGARFLEAYYRAPLPGPAWASLLAARTVASALASGDFARRLFSSVPMQIYLDGEERLPEDRYRLLVASTVPDVGI